MGIDQSREFREGYVSRQVPAGIKEEEKQHVVALDREIQLLHLPLPAAASPTPAARRKDKR